METRRLSKRIRNIYFFFCQFWFLEMLNCQYLMHDKRNLIMSPINGRGMNVLFLYFYLSKCREILFNISLGFHFQIKCIFTRIPKKRRFKFNKLPLPRTCFECHTNQNLDKFTRSVSDIWASYPQFLFSSAFKCYLFEYVSFIYI